MSKNEKLGQRKMLYIEMTIKNDKELQLREEV